MSASAQQTRCCSTKQAAGRSTLGVATVAAFAGAAVYVLAEFGAREQIPGVPDDGDALFWSDFAATLLAVAAGALLLFPEMCCAVNTDLSSLRRERLVTSALLLFAVLLTSITARVRDVNMKLRQDESYVCGRFDDPLACPSQRVQLSEAYQTWRKGNEDVVECYFNTSSPNPMAFLWGEEYSNLTSLATSDFASADTYAAFPEYAPCFYYGCAESCTSGQRAFQTRMLRFEVLLSVVGFVCLTLALCTRAAYTPFVVAKEARIYAV